MRVFNVITFALYCIVSILFISVSLGEVLNWSFVLDLGSSSVREDLVFLYLIPTGMFLGVISYINSYRMFRFKVLPLVVIIILLWVLAFTKEQDIALAAVTFTMGSIFYTIFLLLVLHFSNMLVNKLKDRNGLD
ncbi:MAG: hypothetical protein MRY49_01450 [Candidatus Pacebacteria bacterium]|nr:hypothetical protein [Candidatus Paceibacterota bacterium]